MMKKHGTQKLNGKATRHLAALILAGLATAPSFAYAAEADWKTPEYFASRGLDIVNAAAAYDLGFTGKGIRLGVCDSPVNFKHPDFSGKSDSSMLNEAKFSDVLGRPPFYTIEEYGWDKVTHGTHVAGIAAADRNGVGMHGVAFEAEVPGAVYGEYISRNRFRVDPGYSTFEPYLSMKDVKVINNSWSYRIYLNNFDSLEAYREYVKEHADDCMESIFAATEADKLLMFAAGNVGRPEGNAQALSASLYDEAEDHVIAVTALDDIVKRGPDGEISGTQLMGIFSNLACYAEDYTLAAPGTNILSVNANFAKDGVLNVPMSGTSMATPFVAGGAAVVQQAFPYLSAKQIGDVLLSTGNPNVSATNGYVVSYQNRNKVNIFYTDPKVTDKTHDEMHQDIKKLLEEKGRDTSDYPYSALQRAFDNRNCEYVPYYQVPMEALVGQGVLDVGKAVRGLAALNARRLSADDISDDYTVLGKEADQALYTVNTAGYDSEWSNDIREIRAGYLAADSTEEDLKARYNYYKVNWLDNPSGKVKGTGAMEDYIKEFNDEVEKSGLAGLHVGLLKTGEGSLTLSGGDNTYQGASVAAEGTLLINGSVAGDAYSVENGVIGGSGKIGGTLYNEHIAVAGDAAGKGNLTAANLVSGGKLVSVISDNVNTQFIVEGTADVEGSTIEVDDILPGESFTVLIAGKVTGTPKNLDNIPISGMLSEKLEVGESDIKVSVTASNNLGTSDARINETYDAMVSMHKTLDDANDPREEEMRPLFDLESPSANEALSSISSGAAAKSASLAQTSAVTGHIVSSRLAEVFATRPVTVHLPAARLDEEEEKAGGVALPMKLPQAADNEFWFKAAKNWGDLKGGAYYHGTSFAVGWDRAYSKAWRGGAFVSYGTVGFADTGARNELKDTRLGLYGGYSVGPHAGYVYLDYGWLKNDLQRSIAHLGLFPKAEYDSRILELGGEYKYDLHAGKDTPWHISPYANMQLSGLWQDGYTERDAGTVGQRVDSATNTYFAGGLGFEFRRYLANGSYALRLGAKHAFTGADPKLTFGYVGDNASKYEMRNEQDKTHFVMSLGGEAEFAPGWWLAGDATLQKSSHDKDVMCALTLRRMW